MTKPLVVTLKPVIKAVVQRRRAPHHCKAADRYLCLSVQHTTPEFNVSTDLARCLNGCQCDCHEEANGAEIASEAWKMLYGEDL